MRTAVIVFPGSNCDRDMQVALRDVTGADPMMVWHKNSALPRGLDLVALPGGFSFGDHLRCGAIAARSPIMQAVVDFASEGGAVLGVCNGFQVLVETGLLPGALIRNSKLKFVSKPVPLVVENTEGPFLSRYRKGATISVPVAHHDGCYLADSETLTALRAEGRIALRYAEPLNGSMNDIAGILSPNRRVLGMMPHPERAIDPALGSTDGRALFEGLSKTLLAA